MLKIILDTDIGDDIDDALALALALKSHRLDVIGVTCVYKNTALRARQAKKVISLCGDYQIPVYAGHGHTVTPQNFRVDIFSQYTEDLELPIYEYENMEEGICGESAIDFIIDSVKRWGDELVLVAVGPMTNIAHAIQQAPDVMKNAKLLIMGGDYRNDYGEWNISCDPVAADIVFRSGMTITCFGHEVSSTFLLSDEQLKAVFAETDSPLRSYLSHILRLWMDKNERNPILHDPVTIRILLDPDRFVFEKVSVQVQTEGPKRGHTFSSFDPEQTRSSSVYIVSQVQKELCIQSFFDTLFPEPNTMHVSP